jgi:hypothetical protein
MLLNEIIIERKTGNEKIISATKDRTIIDYWKWAFSDLIGNTERGMLAEYLVALACGIDEKVRISWGSYDMELDNGIRIEVKSSAYIQTWKQKSYSKPSFGIQKTKAWDHVENIFDEIKKRQADIYVFALLAHKKQDTINPLDTDQWEFYLLKTEVLNHYMGDFKTIGLERIKQLNAVKSNFEQLHEHILSLINAI